MRTMILTCTAVAAAVALTAGCGKDPATLLAGGKPDMPPPLAALSFGMAKADALAAAGPAGRIIGGTLWPKGYRKLEMEMLFGYGDDRFEKIDISFPEGTNAAELAEKAWGPPLAGKDGGKDVKIWLNPDKGIRAYFSKASYDTRLFIEPYSPLEAFLGAEGKTFAFESKQKIIGASKADLVTAYRLKDDRIRFPASRCADASLTMLVHFDEQGKATSYQTTFENGYCDLDGEAVKQALEKKFGKAWRLAAGDQTLFYAQDPDLVTLTPVGGSKWAGQGKAGWALAVLPRPTKAKVVELVR